MSDPDDGKSFERRLDALAALFAKIQDEKVRLEILELAKKLARRTPKLES